MKDNWGKLTPEKKMVVTSFLFVFLTFATVGILFEQTTQVSSYGVIAPYDGMLPTEYTELSTASSDPGKLKAMIKGSIYKTGENMTVYGACFDGDGYLLPEATALFTAWYPNGSIVTGPNASMDDITEDFQGTSVNGTGRYKIHVTMSSTLGTYLTEMRCVLDGEWAVAFGEWQNPDWVQDIANTYANVSNIYTLLQNVAVNLSQFQDDTNYNFSQVLNAIDASGGDITNIITQLTEFESQLRDLDINRWLIDATNPFYVLGSGTHNWRAVDMLNSETVAAVSSDGYFAIWDGETWSEVLVSGTEFRGVSILPTTQVYAWGIGGDSGSVVISINGANSTVANLTGGSPTVGNDIKMFQAPNNPSSDFYVYILGNDGSAYISTDSGVLYSLIGTLDAGNVGRISQVVENYDAYGQVNGYMTIMGQGSTVAVHDGATWTNYSISGTVRGVDLLYYDLGYVVVEDTSDTKIYKYNGTAFELEYTINDSSIVPTGVEIHAQNDVWVTTRDPSTFYHFDGRSWEYSTLAYSDFASVIISFNGNGSNVTGTGLHDFSMSDSRHGYAVGDDGLILIYEGQTTTQLADLLANLTTQIGAVQVNLTPIIDALDAMNLTIEGIDANTLIIIQNLQEVNLTTNDILTYVQDINLTLTDLEAMAAGNFTLINTKLDAINLTVEQNQVLINALNVTMNTRFDSVDAALVNMNTTLVNTFDLVTALNATTVQGFQDLTALINALNVTIDGRFNSVDGNLTAIYDAILALNLSMSQEFTDLTTLINAMNATMNTRFDYVDGNLTQIYDFTVAMNTTIINELQDIDDFLFAMNNTMDYKLDNILLNVTFTNQYLTTTIYPLLNSTYVGVQNILIQLGIMNATLNTIQDTTNQTLIIVNETASDIDYLVNKSNRIRAWITQ